MKLSKNAAVLLGVVALACSLPVMAQEGPPPPNADMSIDMDSVGLGAPGPMIAVDTVPSVMMVPGAVMHGEMGPHSGFGGLGLNDDQYEKLYAIKRDSMIKHAQRMGDMVAAESQLHDLLLQPQLDSAKIHAAQDRINALRAEMANMRLDNTIATMSVLTPEQRKELRERFVRSVAGGGMMGMGGGHGWHHGGHHGPGGPECGPGGPHGPGGPPPGGPEGH